MNREDIISKLKPTLKSFFKIKHSTESYSETEDIMVSKVGGLPYWPFNKEYPKLSNKYAKLVFQLNITEALSNGIDFSKTIPDFPNKGILQFFFTEDDDMWGYPDSDDSTLIIYHEDLSIEHKLSQEIIDINLNHENMPFDSSNRVSFEPSEELLGPQDIYNTSLNQDLIDSIGFNDDNEDIYYDLDEANNAGSKIGGYAFFTQSDPLYYSDKTPDDIVLLLQLDSDDELDLMWGDCGVANWRISSEHLKNKNFSTIYYNWDCC